MEKEFDFLKTQLENAEGKCKKAVFEKEELQKQFSLFRE